jgi:carbon storage regulator CsrA
MLVLSRRHSEKILFPNLGISIEVLNIAGKLVRLGVTAPRDISVVREEIQQRTSADPLKRDPLKRDPLKRDPLKRDQLKRDQLKRDQLKRDPPSAHEVRGQLNNASLALHLAVKQFRNGRVGEAEESLNIALQKLSLVDGRLAGQSPAPAQRSRIQALLVDDNENESALLASFLRLSGIDVDRACDGCDALDYLSSHERPDVVLLDMRMPRFDGPSTVAAIRRNPTFQGLKVVAVSGSPPDEYAIVTGPDGVDDWFQKPLDPCRLAERVAALAHGPG